MMNLQFTIYDLRFTIEIKRHAGTFLNPQSVFRDPQFIVPLFSAVILE